MRYYVDTCIWLNLFKKGGDPSKGVPYWEIAQEFLRQMLFSRHQIVYSGVVLRELQIKLAENYQKARLYIEGLRLMKIDMTDDDKIMARGLESQYGFEISFYDLMHITLCKRHNCILITRDKQMTEIARENGVLVCKPEES
jgi:predicted nucleic acid-binding protein